MQPTAAAPALSYPYPTAPEPGQAVTVAPGLLWLRMPLPMAGLNHINVWAAADAPGWTLIDTGMHTAHTATHWQSAFSGVLKSLPVVRVICTHMHPDHIGMAGWLTRQYECRLWTTRLEYLTCRMLVADTGREAPPDGVRFYRRPAGTPQPSTATRRASAASARRSTRCPTATGAWPMARSSRSASMRWRCGGRARPLARTPVPVLPRNFAC